MPNRIEEPDPNHRQIPGYVKIILLAQAATILALTIAMHQVYLNDIYFQQYVISLFRSNTVADATLSVVTVSVFALGTLTLLGTMSSTRRASKEWRLMSEQPNAPQIPQMPQMLVLKVVEPSSKPRSTNRRPRKRKQSADSDWLYESKRYPAGDRSE